MNWVQCGPTHIPRSTSGTGPLVTRPTELVLGLLLVTTGSLPKDISRHSVPSVCTAEKTRSTADRKEILIAIDIPRITNTLIHILK
jgi:hypothetical protein